METFDASKSIFPSVEEESETESSRLSSFREENDQIISSLKTTLKPISDHGNELKLQTYIKNESSDEMIPEQISKQLSVRGSFACNPEEVYIQLPDCTPSSEVQANNQDLNQGKKEDASKKISDMTAVNHTEVKRDVQGNEHTHSNAENDIIEPSTSVKEGNEVISCNLDQGFKLMEYSSSVEENNSSQIDGKDNHENKVSSKCDVPQKRKTRSSSSPSGKLTNLIFSQVAACST